MTPIFTVIYLTLRYQNFEERRQAGLGGNYQISVAAAVEATVREAEKQ